MLVLLKNGTSKFVNLTFWLMSFVEIKSSTILQCEQSAPKNKTIPSGKGVGTVDPEGPRNTAERNPDCTNQNINPAKTTIIIVYTATLSILL